MSGSESPTASSVPCVPKVHRAQNVFDVIKTILIMLSAHLEEMMPIITISKHVWQINSIKIRSESSRLSLHWSNRK